MPLARHRISFSPTKLYPSLHLHQRKRSAIKHRAFHVHYNQPYLFLIIHTCINQLSFQGTEYWSKHSALLLNSHSISKYLSIILIPSCSSPSFQPISQFSHTLICCQTVNQLLIQHIKHTEFLPVHHLIKVCKIGAKNGTVLWNNWSTTGYSFKKTGIQERLI